jgi:hypothetical protein
LMIAPRRPTVPSTAILDSVGIHAKSAKLEGA